MCLIKTSQYAASGEFSIFDNVEEHDSEEFFFCGETDIITKDTWSEAYSAIKS